MAKTIKVYEVLFHSDNPSQAYAGAFGDGSFIQRFRKEADAVRFAASHEYYGKPCTVGGIDAPKRLAQRWGVC